MNEITVQCMMFSFTEKFRKLLQDAQIETRIFPMIEELCSKMNSEHDSKKRNFAVET